MYGRQYFRLHNVIKFLMLQYVVISENVTSCDMTMLDTYVTFGEKK